MGIVIENTSTDEDGELRRYNVNINGYDTVLQLTETDAERRGLSDKDLAGDAEPKKSKPAKKAAAKKAAAAPANKAVTPDNK